MFGNEVELPCFKTAAEAHDLCQYYLLNDHLRQRLVEASNRCIDNGHRFRHRLRKISEVTGVSVHGGEAGTFDELKPASRSRQNNGKTMGPKKAVGGKNKMAGSLSALRTLNSSLQVTAVNFQLQAFQSETGKDFTALEVRAVSTEAKPGSNISLGLRLPKSRPFIRLDLGDYYSVHSHPVIKITRLDAVDPSCYLLDFEKDILQAHQLAYDSEKLTCGFDAHFIFENPFVGSDVDIHFESELCAGL